MKTESDNNPDYKRIVAGIAALTALYGLIFAPSYFANRARAAAPQCWDIKDVSGHLYKLNRCTGDVVPLDSPPTPAADK